MFVPNSWGGSAGSHSRAIPTRDNVQGKNGRGLMPGSPLVYVVTLGEYIRRTHQMGLRVVSVKVYPGATKRVEGWTNPTVRGDHRDGDILETPII